MIGRSHNNNDQSGKSVVWANINSSSKHQKDRKTVNACVNYQVLGWELEVEGVIDLVVLAQEEAWEE